MRSASRRRIFNTLVPPSVPGLLAKPVLDIAVRLAPDAQLDRVVEALTAKGFEFRGDKGAEGGALFVLSDGPEHRVAHIHVVEHDDPQWDRYLIVRDRLRSDPGARAAYGALKGRLAEQHPSDRASYTAAKSGFIADLLSERDIPPAPPLR
jgi:GrpB-like predicted nucleotidyltransferase (UPF0157 family)